MEWPCYSSLRVVAGSVESEKQRVVMESKRMVVDTDHMERHELADRQGDPRMPNLFIIGAQKSATTSLAAALSKHPDIFIGEIKEPNFFANF